MEFLDEHLQSLPERHQRALRWFREHGNTIQPWPQPLEDGTLLMTKAKGIYKPEWSEYALSVRQTLGSPYPDREPVTRPDGTWRYDYFQENASPDERDAEFTNAGLLACRRDRVPIGVARQVSPKPNVRYRILGLALVSGWDAGYVFLEGFSSVGLSRTPGPATELEALEEQLPISSIEFDPAGVLDARKRTLAAIVRRQGQPAFRAALLQAYGGRCAITGCDAEPALEAVHITPYRGAETNLAANGLLLRADLHTLFDRGLIAVDPDTRSVLVAPSLLTTDYGALHGRILTLPPALELRPSLAALKQHLAWTGLASDALLI